MGSLVNIVSVCSGRAGAIPGRNRQVLWFQALPRFRVQKVACPRFRRFRCSMGSDGLGYCRFCSRGLDGTGSGNRVPGTRGIKKVSGSGDSVPKVPKLILFFEKALLYLEGILLYFENTFVLWKYTFACALWKYVFANWNYNFVLWKYTFVLCKYTFVLCHNACFRLHWRSIHQGQRKGGNWCPLYKRNLLAVGDTTYAYFFKKMTSSPTATGNVSPKSSDLIAPYFWGWQRHTQMFPKS